MAVELEHTDEIAAGLLLALSALVFVLSRDFPQGPSQTSPAFFPRFLAALIACFALFQLARSVRADAARSHEITRSAVVRVATVAGLIAGYVLTLPLMGFLVGTVLFLVVAMWYSGVDRFRRTVPIAVAFSIGLHYVFGVFLRIPLPESAILPISRLLPTTLATLGLGVAW